MSGIDRPAYVTRYYVCDKCDRRCILKSYLSKHLVMHRTTKDFICDWCPSAFKARRRLRTHKLQVHRKTKVSCEQYDKSIARHAFVQHRRTHNAMTCEWPCTDCGKHHNSADALRYHRRAVHSTKQYLCDKCAKVFKMKHSVNRHIRNKHQ